MAFTWTNVSVYNLIRAQHITEVTANIMTLYTKSVRTKPTDLDAVAPNNRIMLSTYEKIRKALIDLENSANDITNGYMNNYSGNLAGVLYGNNSTVLTNNCSGDYSLKELSINATVHTGNLSSINSAQFASNKSSDDINNLTSNQTVNYTTDYPTLYSLNFPANYTSVNSTVKSSFYGIKENVTTHSSDSSSN